MSNIIAGNCAHYISDKLMVMNINKPLALPGFLHAHSGPGREGAVMCCLWSNYGFNIDFGTMVFQILSNFRTWNTLFAHFSIQSGAGFQPVL